MLKDFIDYLKEKHIVLLGFGREGRSSLAFIRRHEAAIKPASVIIADKNDIPDGDYPPYVRFFCGEDYTDALKEGDIALKSPGISFKNFSIRKENGRNFLAEYPGCEISGQSDLFLRFAPAHIIGVSGTKGKTTTTSFIYLMLCEAFGKEKCFLLGNIGVPVLDAAEAMDENSYCALELSSHQLQFCTASPETAVLSNFYPEHLDHYRSYAAYIDAKLNILRFQDKQDTAVLCRHEEELMTKAAPGVKGRLLTVSDGRKDQKHAADIVLKEEGCFTFRGKDYQLPENDAMLGRHVSLDALLALAAASSQAVDPETALRGIAAFRGIRHRLEPLGSFAGRRFYNDSIATIPQAALLALDALKERGKVTTLIAGGMDRGLDYEPFAEALYRYDLRHLIALPDTGSELARLLREKNKKRSASEQIIPCEADTMEEAADLAYQLTKAGEICLLSPAASSYNRYKNFEERGDAFRQAVQKLEGRYGAAQR